MAKQTSKHSTTKSAANSRKRAPKKAANQRTAKVQRGTAGTGPRTSGAKPMTAGTVERANKAKEKPCD